MNIGCIPSKSLLSMAKAAHYIDILPKYELSLPEGVKPTVLKPFERIQGYLAEVQKSKMMKTFEKIEAHVKEGDAKFVGHKIVESNGQRYTAKRIFINSGTRPFMPPIQGLRSKEVEPHILTNENIFNLRKIPKSMIVIGGGAIGCEMAQAMQRLGSKCTIIQNGEHVLPAGEKDGALLIEEQFKNEGITLANNASIEKVEKDPQDSSLVIVTLKDGKVFKGEKILVAAGRQIFTDHMQLGKTGVATDKSGKILVNNYLETNVKGIYACGDVNGHALLSHAAMHQGMIALMNSMVPNLPGSSLMKQNFKRYIVPWTVFTNPEISCVGMTPMTLKKRNIPFETIEQTYKGYGSALAQGHDKGFIKLYISPKIGKIYGAQIVGENSGELINEYAMAIQNGLSMRHFLMTQHSFPTMGWMNKRLGEVWMEKKMNDFPVLKTMCKAIYKFKF